ncbi:SoxR reducing system RseC family protein [Aliiglaciecola sp. CAU 1673]|uniref:SoxR reducing system RseC family protein n=1 Tax=Aliiglaciecola sp. CAU 1673 TaxID=3032595 RepID=UPI0023D9B9A6|nr:SoxR reducing system RseC family protein [Aliiglaciecola sp. CAU 1673]MDF2177997.1 SoxR reducing system RseC family protein [Aliiglaciecola sp. CAU 1673]
MIEEVGVIKAVDGDHIWVETEIKTTCGGCVAQETCGTGAIARSFSPKKQTLIFRCQQPAQVGQRVKLGVPEQDLLGASMLVYLLPLLALLGAAFVSHLVLQMLSIQGEGWIILSSLSAMTLCFLAVRRNLNRAPNQRYHPRLLEVISGSGAPSN